MRKIVFRGHADIVGTDYARLEEIEDDVDGPITNGALDDWAEELGIEWANMFEPDIGGEDDDYEDVEDYYQACGWWWEEYNPEMHDGIIT